MNVKMNRLRLIDALKNEIAKREKVAAEQAKYDAEYDAAFQKRQDAIIKAINSGKAKVKDADARYWPSDNTVHVVLTLPAGIPAQPERKYTDVRYQHHELGELKAVVTALELSDETNIGASTYKNVLQYLG